MAPREKVRIKKVYSLEPNVTGDGRYVEAIISVFGNVDAQGDRVMPGAFLKSIGRWRASGDPVPWIWSHNWGDPWAHLGSIDPRDMREVRAGEIVPGSPPGLFVRATMDLDENPTARYVAQLIKERRVNNYSFAYDIAPGGERRARDGATDLTELDILEGGPTLVGANGQTMTVSSKAIEDLYERTRPRDLTLAEIDALTKATHPLPATSTLAGSALASHLAAAHGNVLAVELLATNDEGLQRRHELLHATGPSDHSHEPKGRRADSELKEINRTLDRLQFGDLRKRADAAEVDQFIAQVRAEVRAEKARAAERARLIAMTNGTPAGDAPRVGPDMVPVE
jgi:HK97 family phage prohead protease